MKLKSSWIILGLIVLLAGCRQNYVPKPKGYFRIDLPTQVQYTNIPQNFSYTFQQSEYAGIKELPSDGSMEWANLHYNKWHATVHLSYQKVNDNLAELIDDAHKFVFKHTVKADAIDQKVFYYPEHKTAGVIYQLKGNTASPYQFFATDSTEHFLRGALYFEARPNVDSLMPLINFMEEDVYHLIETLEWK